MDTIEEASLDIFSSPARLIISGYSNSGKSYLTTQLIEKYYKKFIKIIICSPNKLGVNDLDSKVIYTNDIIDPTSEVNDYETGNILYILDDCFSEAVNNTYVVDAFTKGRHHNISCILITQNLFFKGKYARNIALNATHFILLKQRDLGQITLLARQIFGSPRSKEVTEIYKKAMQEMKYGYLLIDLSVTTTEFIQFRTKIVDEGPFEIAYLWS